jgi:hypothetical protein
MPHFPPRAPGNARRPLACGNHRRAAALDSDLHPLTSVDCIIGVSSPVSARETPLRSAGKIGFVSQKSVAAGS